MRLWKQKYVIVMSRIIGGTIGLIGAILMLVSAGLTVADIAPLFGYLPTLPAGAQVIIYIFLACLILGV